MMKVYVAAACGTAFLALALGSVANAQVSSGRYVNQCWDQATNDIRDRNGGSGNTAKDETSSAGTNSAASGSPRSSSSGASSASGKSGSANAPTRPAGLPNC
jgi:hypothetical protein